MGVAISLANPSHTLFPLPSFPQAWRLLAIKTKSKRKQVPVGKFEDSPAVLIKFNTWRCPHLPWEAGGVWRKGRGEESPLVNAFVPSGRLAPLERSWSWGRGSRWQLPLPSDAFQVLPAPLCGVEGLRKKRIFPWAHWELPTLGLDFCACAMCLGGEATDPGPPLTLFFFFLFFKVEHHTGPGTPEWVQAAGSLSHRSPGDR